MTSTHDIDQRSGGTRRVHPAVIVAIVLVLVFIVLPVLLIIAISFLGTASETQFTPVGSSIG
jgi:ABC-type spermidine/putrescine transport system permease subunit II